MWMNLHHFFYEQASHGQRNKLQEDSLDLRDIGDQMKLSQLSSEEKQVFGEGVAFYQQHIIDQELLHSRNTFKWLQAQATDQAITDTALSAGFTRVLNRLRPFYQAHFWLRHQKENQALIDRYIELIRKTETLVIPKMEELSGAEWQGRVRVDLTTYGNWAGAYSPDFDNIVVSSIDPLMNSSLFIEFVFHESSHLLFPRKSTFRMALFTQSKAMEIKQPRNLWHAAMFYLTGLATQDALAEQGVQHQLIMERKNVFLGYYQQAAFRSILMSYYHQEIGSEEMAEQLLNLE